MRPNATTREASRWPTRTLTRLLLRALVLKEHATVVDAVSMPTLSPPRSPIRARDEMCLFIVGACERTACCTCQPAVACKDLRGVCMCIDLVFSYSIDATNCLFAESDALKSRFFLQDPLELWQSLRLRFYKYDGALFELIDRKLQPTRVNCLLGPSRRGTLS